MKTIVVRKIPDDLHRLIRVAAATAGQGVSEWTLNRLLQAVQPIPK